MIPHSHRNVGLLSAAIATIAFYWTIALYPTPARLLSEHGQGYQLAAASEILAGRHPVLDFNETYGPLTFYASAVAQWVSGGRVLGELSLIAAAFALSYALLFRLMIAGGIDLRIAVAMSCAAIVVQPVGYRYYLLLCPLLALAAAWRYVERPGRSRLALLGLAVTVAGLFRPDLGVYLFVTALVLIFAAGNARPLRNAASLTAWILVWASPWLLWLAWHGKLGDYLYISSLEATQEAAGRAKPPPWPDFAVGLFAERNLKAFLFRLPLLMLGLAAVMLVVRRNELRGAARARLWAAFVLAALTTLQASHIVDWIHVRDTLPIRFLLLGWITTGALASGATGDAWWTRRFLPLAAVIVLTGSAMVGSLLKERESSLSPVRLAAKVRDYSLGRDALLARVREGRETFRAELYEYVRDHSAPDETIFAVLEAPQMNYFANRRFASRQMAIFPGYFASPRHQQRMMAEIRRGPTAFVVIDHLEMADYPEGAMARFAPDVLRFLNEEFVEVARIGYCRVLAPRWRKPDR